MTIIEVVISTVVLLLAIMGSIVALQAGFRDMELARDTAAATQVMQNEAERLRLLNWNAISSLPSEQEVDLSTTMTGKSLLFGRLRLLRFVSDVDGFENMKEIRLEARWTSANGQPHDRSLILRYSKGGVHDYYYGT